MTAARGTLAALFWAASLSLAAAEVQPGEILGLTPEAAYQAKGAPASVYAVALDDNRWQAVHFYADHSYLFWADNHVWQVRLDKAWAGTLKGLTMGASRSDVEAVWGPPLVQTDTGSVWDLPFQTFPRRLRLVFTDDKLSDAYLYRSAW